MQDKLNRIKDYLKEVSVLWKTGAATELSYRAALQSLLADLIPGVTVVNEPAHISCGAPDLLVRSNAVTHAPVGYVETKDIDDGDLDGNGKNKEQFDRYKADLDNIIFTDYLDFRFCFSDAASCRVNVDATSSSRQKETESLHSSTSTPNLNSSPVEAVRIATLVNGNLVVAPDAELERFAALVDFFGTAKPKPITSPARLAMLMAGKARLLARSISATLEADKDGASQLSQQMGRLHRRLSAGAEVAEGPKGTCPLRRRRTALQVGCPCVDGNRQTDRQALAKGGGHGQDGRIRERQRNREEIGEMKIRMAFSAVCAGAMLCSVAVAREYTYSELRVRDPFVVNVGGERPYRLYMSDTWLNGKAGMSVSSSEDLVHWSEPKNVLAAPDWCGQVWAPEVHEWKGAWYAFLTLKEKEELKRPIKTLVPGEPDWEPWPGGKTNSTCHAVWVYRSESPDGPFVPVSDTCVTPPDWVSLDGTLAVEDGKPWMVFTHDWAQVKVGTYELAPMSDDLTRFLAPPKTLFTAGEFPMTPERGVTDGAYLYRSTKSGKLFMIWSTHNPARPAPKDYCVVSCESASGRLAGPWVNHRLLFDENGGHGMFFRKTDGSLTLCLHSPEKWGEEHPLFLPVEDTGDGLRVVAPAVRSDFPGGNGRFEGIDAAARVLTVRKEPKGSGEGRHYYFYFEVAGLSGKWTVRIVDTPALTRMGPAVSTDGGETWRFLFDKPVPPPGVETFEYDFPADGKPVRFCVSVPYGEKDWQAFVARHAGNPAAKLGEFCKDRSGRSIERFDIPNRSGKPAWTFLFTARHHASEVSASAVLEGILDEALADTPEGRWVRENGQVVAVPFMDKDGVVAGDQGKRRLPHDHNRDYVQEIYPSVKALKRLAKDAPGKLYHVDLHAPSLKGKEHDHMYAICPEGARYDVRWRAFSQAFETATADAALKYDPQWNIPFGHFWNNDRLFSGDGTVQQSNRWFSKLPNCYLSFCLENGYGLCGGVYSREAARELGRNALKAIVRSVWKAPEDDGIARVTPKATDEILCNPGMGFFHFFYSGRLWAYGAEQAPDDVLDWMPGMTVAYLRLPWTYIEPQDGIFRWDLLDGRMQPWIRAGKKIGLRISIMNISFDSTPQWVRDAGAKGHDYLYNAKAKPCWEPEWDDPVLLAKLEHFYKAFAARYDGNEDIAFVDVGSFGLFGEGHSTTLAKLNEENPDEFIRIAKLHIDLLRKAMPRTYLVISDDVGGGGWARDKDGQPLKDHPIFAYCRSLGIGLRDDSIMCNAEHPWASDNFGRLFAETTPVILETGQITRRMEKNSWFPEKLLKCVEAYHASYLGVHGFPDLVWEKNKHVWRETANRLGYRFELRNVEYPRTVRTDERVTIGSTWVNVGVAPRYAGGAVTWNLVDDKGVVCWRTTDETFDFKDLRPTWDGVERPVTLASSCTFGCTAEVPDNGNDMILNWCKKNHRNDPGKEVVLLKPGTYTLAVSVGRRNGTAEIALPLENGKERIYPIGKMTVVK